MHVLIIPSWYPQFEGDPGGSFFREQAIALTRLMGNVGVLFPNQRSLRELWNLNASKFGIHFINDAGTNLVQRNGFNLTPRYENGVSFQFVRHGLRLYAEYVGRFGTPDIIHAHSALYGGLLAFEIARKTGIPYVVTEHATGYARNLFNSKQLSWAEKIYANSAANIAVSHSLGRLLKDRYEFDYGWKTIPNIVSEAFFAQSIERFEQPSPRCRFLHVAMLHPGKRQDLLIEAVAICRRHGRKDLTLTIAGDGVERDRIRRLIKELGVGDQVHLVGMLPRKQIPALMATHDAFVLSSDFETFGVVLAEALATGLPCIATDCGGPTEVIGSGDGVIVPCGDPNSIAEAMLAIAEGAESSAAIEARKHRCAERFSEYVVCQALNDIYRHVIGQHR